MKTQIKSVHTSSLNICYEESGEANHCPVILLHGFPDDVRAWDKMIPQLVNNDYRIIAPYLRGFGKTYLHPDTLRSGQQAALGHDVLELMNCLNIEKAILVGYDWGGRAACVVSALWPERVLGLVSIGGAIQNIPSAQNPAVPELEYRFWYQWYFNTVRGRLGLEKNRYALCRLLWQQWSPTWKFDNEDYARTAQSFDNPDFVDVVIHSYRHRYGKVSGDPALESIESKLANEPLIHVPTISMDGANDGLDLPDAEPEDDAHLYSSFYERRIIANVGHFMPRESPEAVVKAIVDLKKIFT